MYSSWLFFRGVLGVIFLWGGGCASVVYTIEDHQEKSMGHDSMIANQAACPICLDGLVHPNMPIVCPFGAACPHNKHLACVDCLIKVVELCSGQSYDCPACRATIDKMHAVYAVIHGGKSDGDTCSFIEKKLLDMFDRVARDFSSSRTKERVG